MYHYTVARRIGILVSIHNLAHKAGMTTLFGVKGPILFSYVKPSPDEALRRMWNFLIFRILHIGEGRTAIKNGWYLVLPRRERFSRHLSVTYHRPNRLSNAYLNSVKKVRIHD